MFKVERIVTSLVTNRPVNLQRTEHTTLIDALKKMEELRLEDRARYKCMQLKKPNYFFDESHDEISYHFVVGKCIIGCEILGIEEDARKEFYIERQELLEGE